ncbi:MAG TPA: hypothetical protein VLA54_00400 [Acidimicrobiia bacterium]|nr:hypothetical protein [Acidimicrobiia bacterium]
MRRSGAVVVVVGLLAACGTGDSTPPNTTPPTGPTTTAAATVEQFAFIRDIDATSLTFDPAEILTGEEARRAAVEAGVIAEGEDLPNDFFIDNPDEATTVASLSPDTEYMLLGFDTNGAIQEQTVDSATFVAVVIGGSEQYYGIVPGEVPANLALSGDVVTAVEQVYFP